MCLFGSDMLLVLEVLKVLDHLSAIDRLLQRDQSELLLLLCITALVWYARRFYDRRRTNYRSRLTFQRGSIRNRVLALQGEHDG